MAKEVGSRELAAASGVTSNKALDALLQKKHLLDEVDQAKAELQAVNGEQVASADADQASAEGSAAAEGEVVAVVADSGIIMTDAVSVAGAAGAGGLSTNTLLLIGGGTLVGGTAIALSSDGGGSDGGDGGSGGNGGNGGQGAGGKVDDPNPGTNDAPILTLVKEESPHVENSLLVAKFSAIDPDNQVNQTSKIVLSGADAALFTIVDGTLQFKAAPDYENPQDAGKNNVYDVTLTVADAEGDATKSTTYNYSFEVKNDITSAGEKPGDATEGADTFTLSDNGVGQAGPDNLGGKGGDDKFIAAVGDLDSQDNLDGGAGNDTLTASIGNNEDETPTITGIETINVESVGGTTNSLNLIDATGVVTINVLDNGDGNGPLFIKNIDDDNTRVNLKGDQDVTLTVKNSAGTTDALDTGVDGFKASLIVGNAVESLKVAGISDSAFSIKDTGGALKTVTFTGDADLTVKTFASTTYDFTATTGDNSLTFANPAKGAATVLFGAGDDVVDFGITLEDKGTPADKVNGGAGDDVFKADIDQVDVEPTISNVETISLAFLGKGNFDASGVTNSKDGTDYEVRASTGYVNINDITNGANINIVGNVKNGDQGSTFDFAGKDATTTITFVTKTAEQTAITHTGDVEVNDVADLTVDVDGLGEVVIEGAIALDEDATTDLHISTNSEDDDDADNDGDLTVHGAGEDGAITQSSALVNLTVEAVNGNIFLGDGQVADSGEALGDASSLETLTLLADNATLAIGDIGDGEEGEADNLDTVNITGANRGLFNLDDIIAGTYIQNESGNNESGATFGFTTGSSAFIEEFNITTAERSETKNTFEEDSTPFGFNDVGDIVARVIEDFEINVAKDGRLHVGDLYTSVDNLTITGAGRLDIGNNESNNVGSVSELADADDQPFPGFAFNSNFDQFYLNEVNAKNHTGPIELDFRTFTGADFAESQNGGFDNQGFVDANIVLGNQNTVDNGIRLDSYGFDVFSTIQDNVDDGSADVTITAGNGNHLAAKSEDESDGFDEAESGPTDLLGEPLYGIHLVGPDATEFSGGTGYGIITGFGDDSVTTGTGSSSVYGGTGDDTISVGAGSDLVRGGFGEDTIDLGKADGVADYVQFVGGYTEDAGGVVNNFFAGETIGQNFDRVLNFEAGAGKDVVELWNFGLNGGDDGIPFVGPVAVHEEVVADQDSIIDLLPDFINFGLSQIVEFKGINLNLDLKDTSLDHNLIESDFFQAFIGDVVNLGGGGAAGFFAIAYDAEGDDAALFLIDGDLTDGPDFILGEDSIKLVGIFEGVSTGQFNTGDFTFHQAETPVI